MYRNSSSNGQCVIISLLFHIPRGCIWLVSTAHFVVVDHMPLPDQRYRTCHMVVDLFGKEKEECNEACSYYNVWQKDFAHQPVTSPSELTHHLARRHDPFFFFARHMPLPVQRYTKTCQLVVDLFGKERK